MSLKSEALFNSRIISPDTDWKNTISHTPLSWISWQESSLVEEEDVRCTLWDRAMHKLEKRSRNKQHWEKGAQHAGPKRLKDIWGSSLKHKSDFWSSLDNDERTNRSQKEFAFSMDRKHTIEEAKEQSESIVSSSPHPRSHFIHQKISSAWIFPILKMNSFLSVVCK